MFLYKAFLKPYLFSLDAEDAHHKTMALFRLSMGLPGMKAIYKSKFVLNDPELETEKMGLKFKNPIGLAAGFDKDGKYVELLQYLGFGFVEVGTVTPLPQLGNPRPRLFRLPKDKALINRMGFNNEGVDELVNRLKKLDKKDLIIGGNIGKNKVTSNQNAWKDYSICFKKLKDYVDYFVVNVSSPNTPGLRELQNKDALTEILERIQEMNNEGHPILLKIAPDISIGELDDILEVVENTNLNGIVTNNTTIARSPLMISEERIAKLGKGGLSGKPLADRSMELLKEVRSKISEDKVVISSGGVYNPNEVSNRLVAGADLVQIYTGLIYQGPQFVKNSLRLIRNTYRNGMG
ncbi:quinone-dependent dihydroorotate dehydrogenase [Membranihabitans maritimus]|uniref:quinone-dependent dihydroorotate dehydrogenase n=1 Tax=Membranihabitans maritimus TaxID=2904244 RepID=UPI001EFFD8D4|nr:quinone-dependent dihydroorotate dehydrogenase [Membranihabitans maritimus]